MCDDSSTEPAMAPIRYANLFGALVTVRDPGAAEPLMLVWSCGGCRDGGQAHNLHTARNHANSHAATCRALPQPPESSANADIARCT
jgi:hypothetical protein